MNDGKNKPTKKEKTAIKLRTRKRIALLSSRQWGRERERERERESCGECRQVLLQKSGDWWQRWRVRTGWGGAAGDLMRKSVVVMRPAAAVMNDTYLRRPAVVVITATTTHCAASFPPLPPHSSPCLLRDPCSLPRSLSLSPLPCLHANDAMPCAPPLSTIHHKRRPAQLNYCMIFIFIFIFYCGGKPSQLAIFFPKWLCVCVCVCFCYFSNCHLFQQKDFFGRKIVMF